MASTAKQEKPKAHIQTNFFLSCHGLSEPTTGDQPQRVRVTSPFTEADDKCLWCGVGFPRLRTVRTTKAYLVTIEGLKLP